MTIVITAFERSPDGGMGLARDTRVRWALEEVGQPYEVRLVSFRAKKEPAHLRLHPFGLIPTYEQGDLALFETGAIVFDIAEHHAGLFPDDANARARAITWMFAALNTVEPPILELVTARFAEGDKPWAEERLPLVKDRIRDRLVQLSARLGDADWLDGAFSAGDLMMVSVLPGCDLRAFWTSSRNWPPMCPAAKRGPRTNVPSPPNGRSTPAIRKLADQVCIGRRCPGLGRRGHPTALSPRGRSSSRGRPAVAVAWEDDRERDAVIFRASRRRGRSGVGGR